VNKHIDTTPFATRVILLTVLVVTAVAHGLLLIEWLNSQNAADTATLLWFFTGLFLIRVIGQVVVAIRPQKWLPPMYQWNFIPYPILLPIQLIFIGVMAWINVSFSQNNGISTIESQSTGKFLVAFSAVYMLAMAVRYTIRMYRCPDQRWFGGTIPIVFHIVLASYLYTLGSFYVIK
jgi:hypothetical protein